MSVILDKDGFRPNVGIIVINDDTNLLWAKRRKRNTWQFPQGGVEAHETTEETLYREMHEELGLFPEDVKVLAETQEWLYYRIPTDYLRHDSRPLCIGQKQKWYLLKILAADHHVCLYKTSNPEFDAWRWVSYWYPVKHAIFFKRQVYKRALKEFEPYIFS